MIPVCVGPDVCCACVAVLSSRGGRPTSLLATPFFPLVAAGHRRQGAAAVVSAVEVGFICAGDVPSVPVMRRIIGIFAPGAGARACAGRTWFVWLFCASVQHDVFGVKEITWVQ